MLASVLLGPYVFTVFYLVLSVLTLTEFYKLIKIGGIRPHRNMGVLVAVGMYLSVIFYHFFQFSSKYLLLNIPMVFSVFVLELYKKEKIPFANIAYTFAGLIYVTLPFLAFHSLGFLNSWATFSFEIPLAFMLMLWSNDTGAYLFGSKFGKHRLFERHSPKKSWEGFIGGVLVSMLTAYVVSIFWHQLNTMDWLCMAVLIACFGTMGDLIESMLKRSLNVKDSGDILPGHGGLLDRFDGLLLAAPVVFTFLYLLKY